MKLDARQVRQAPAVALEHRAARGDALVEHAQLTAPDRRADVRHAGSCSRSSSARSAAPDRAPGSPGSARARRCASSSETSMPPPEVVMILLPLNEKIADACRSVPHCLPSVVGAERLGGVLDDRHVVARAGRHGWAPSPRSDRRGRRR